MPTDREALLTVVRDPNQIQYMMPREPEIRL